MAYVYVIPAKAGIYEVAMSESLNCLIPAFAGMTEGLIFRDINAIRV